PADGYRIQAAQLDLVIAFVRSGTKFHFLDDDLFLLEPRLMLLLAFAVLELAVIHHATNRRYRRRRDLYQIQFRLFRQLVGCGYADHADLGTVGPDDPHFRRGDFTV